MMENFLRVAPEVFYAQGGVVCVGPKELDYLKAVALENPRKRCRICAHPSAEDQLHEMLIVHMGGLYVRPHRHPGKSESFHIIEGCLTVVLFDDAGQEVARVPMGPVSSGRTCFYRLQDCLYHTVLLEDEIVVFHEVTNGPFVLGETEFAPWAPADDDDVGQAEFMLKMMRS